MTTDTTRKVPKVFLILSHRRKYRSTMTRKEWYEKRRQLRLLVKWFNKLPDQRRLKLAMETICPEVAMSVTYPAIEKAKK